MFRRNKFLNFPAVFVAALLGTISGKAIFGPPLEEYWKKKHEEEQSKKEKDGSSSLNGVLTEEGSEN